MRAKIKATISSKARNTLDDLVYCSNCNKLNNINYPFSLEAVECECLLFC